MVHTLLREIINRMILLLKDVVLARRHCRKLIHIVIRREEEPRRRKSIIGTITNSHATVNTRSTRLELESDLHASGTLCRQLHAGKTSVSPYQSCIARTCRQSQQIRQVHPHWQIAMRIPAHIQAGFPS